jgi:prevent-host-death family protein
MKPSEAIKPISYLKAHASEVIRDIADNQKTLVITQNGEAKVVLQDVRTYEETQESLALLKILAVSSKNMKEGKYKPVKEAFKNISNKIEKL